MIQEAIYFWASLITAICSLIAIVFMSDYKRYERENLKLGLNFMMLGVLIIAIASIINMIRFANISYSITLNALLPGINALLPLLVSIKNLFLYPATAIVFLLSAVIYRKR